MVSIAPVTPQNVLTFKTARLRALQDTPSAFGSTYAKEARYSDAEWIDRARQWTGATSTTYIASDGDEPCGIVAGFLNRDEPQRAHLVSMWVAASHRRLGIGRQLVDAIVAWAAARDARALYLHVTSNNETATAFYRDFGFALTGDSEPHPNEPGLTLCEMSMRLRR